MYQGKFSKTRTSPAPKFLPEQESPVTGLPEVLPEPEPPVAEQPVVLPEPESPVVEQPKVLPEPEVSAPRRGPRTSTLIFYTAYVMLILLFIVGMFFTLNTLEQELIDFEASQPDPKSDAVFAELFAQPDWAALYGLAGIEDTVFEGKDAFVSYMEQKVNGQPLTYQATSAGLSGDRKYIVKLNTIPIGSFTLVCDPEAAVPEWQLGKVALSYEYTESIRVRKLSSHTVYVNGVALDDSYTTHIGSTTADAYLPRGVYNVWLHTQQVDGLMVTPQVTAVNEMGESVDVSYDSKTRTYITSDPTNACTDEERDLALNTVKAYVQYMLGRIPKKELKNYFNDGSQPYERILAEEVWMLTNVDAQFENETITSFYRYSDEIYSIRVRMSAYVTRVNGTQKEYIVEKTLIFQQEEDTWVCADMIDQDLSTLDQTVRITFMDGDTVLSTEFYDTDLQELTTPLLTNSSGHTVTGWYLEEIDGNGIAHQILVFTPDSNGTVLIPEDVKLEPMTLYAKFDDITTQK